MIEKLGGRPAYVVAGSLYIRDHRIFGEDGEFDSKRVFFSESNMDWNDHVWIVRGGWIADVSLLRTARGGTLRLAADVAKTFTPTAGPMCCQMETMGGYDFRYVPQYVLPQEQVEGLQRGVVATLDALEQNDVFRRI